MNIDHAFQVISNGNRDAYALCHAIYDWLHAIDDLYDRDKEVSPEDWTEVNMTILHFAAKNEFFRDIFDSVFPIIRASFLAYVASEKYRASEDVQDKVVAEVIKSQYMDIFFEIAFHTGGFDQQRCSNEFRGYHFN